MILKIIVPQEKLINKTFQKFLGHYMIKQNSFDEIEFVEHKGII